MEQQFPHLNQASGNHQSGALYPQGAFQQYLADLKSLHDQSKSFVSEEHLSGDAYSILFPDHLVFYFPTYIIPLHFPTPSLHVSSAKHVHLFDPRKQGFLHFPYANMALIFGTTCYTLVLLDPYNLTETMHKVQWVKQYSGLEPDEQVTWAQIVDEGVAANRDGIPEWGISVVCGTTQKRVIEIRVSVRQDMQAAAGGVLTQQEERVVYQEPKALVSRISNFISSKFGLRGQGAEGGEQDSTKAVRNVQVIGQYVVIVTSKDLVVVRYYDGVKVQEFDFLENMKYQIMQSEVSLNQSMQLMRNIINFHYVTSHASLIGETQQICVNLFAFREQVTQHPQSYQILNESHLLHTSILLTPSVTDSQTDLTLTSNDITLSDLPAGERPVRSLAYSFEFYQDQTPDVSTLLFVETSNSGIMVLEYSLNKHAHNGKMLQGQNLRGVKVINSVDEGSREQIVRASVITEEDVITVEFDPLIARYTSIEPQKLRDIIPPSVENNESLVQQQPMITPIRSIEVITDPVQMKKLIIQLLDQVAAIKYAPATSKSTQFNLRQQQENMIKGEVNMIGSRIGRDEFLRYVMELLEEQVDLQIDDSVFYNRNQDEIRLTFSDDGLISRSLENKQKKVDVIQDFLQISELYDPEQHYHITSTFNRIRINLQFASFMKDMMDQIKLRSQQQSKSSSNLGFKPTDYPLEMRSLSRALYQSSNKLGFDKVKLSHMGKTATNIVFGSISNFPLLLDQLIYFAVDTDSYSKTGFLAPTETSDQLISSVSILVIEILQFYINLNRQYPIADTFLGSSGFLSSQVMELCRAVRDGQTLVQLAESLIEVASFSALENTQPEQFEKMRNELTLLIERASGQVDALNFAKKYLDREELCRLVFDLGAPYFPVIHQSVNDWGEDFLNLAISKVYDLERETIEKRRIGQGIDKPYRGLIIFDLFESQYFKELEAFLSERNRKLLALLYVRNQQPTEANQLLRNEVIPNIEGVQTMKVISSVGLANLQHAQPSVTQQEYTENEQVYAVNLQHATAQSEANPDQPKLQPLTIPLLNGYLDSLNKQNPMMVSNNFNRVLSLLNNSRLKEGQYSDEDFLNMKLALWLKIVRADHENLRKVKQVCLDNQFATTEKLAQDTYTRSIVYQQMSEFSGTETDPRDIWDQLEIENAIHRDALKYIAQKVAQLAQDRVQFSQQL